MSATCSSAPMWRCTRPRRQGAIRCAFSPRSCRRLSVRGLRWKLICGKAWRSKFFLCYQPQSDDCGRITGVEALVRWRHPQQGMISPAEFIPLAEESGLILPLGRWVLETACAQLANWAKEPLTALLDMSVNVSSRQFLHPDFVEQVLNAIDITGADPARLKLELTESLLIDDMDVTIAKMTALKAKGVGFSLDDFGTGYSSLFYLKHLPLDLLKIDQSFVREVRNDPNDAAIVHTIIALGKG